MDDRLASYFGRQTGDRGGDSGLHELILDLVRARLVDHCTHRCRRSSRGRPASRQLDCGHDLQAGSHEFGPAVQIHHDADFDRGSWALDDQVHHAHRETGWHQAAELADMGQALGQLDLPNRRGFGDRGDAKVRAVHHRHPGVVEGVEILKQARQLKWWHGSNLHECLAVHRRGARRHHDVPTGERIARDNGEARRDLNRVIRTRQYRRADARHRGRRTT